MNKISDIQSEDGQEPTRTNKIRFVLVPDSYYQKGMTKEERERNKSIRETYYRIVEEYHSYVAKRRHVGRHIGWLIYCNNKLIGCVGIGSYFLPEPVALKEYIGWNEKKDKNFNCNFNKVANNWRFTLMDNAPHNTASKILSILCKLSRKEWKRKYGDNLVLLVSLVGDGKSGTCFRAANWKIIGKTAGTNTKRHKSFTMSKRRKFGKYGMPENAVFSEGDKKLIFVKPLHRYWKEILNRKV